MNCTRSDRAPDRSKTIMSELFRREVCHAGSAACLARAAIRRENQWKKACKGALYVESSGAWQILTRLICRYKMYIDLCVKLGTPSFNLRRMKWIEESFYVRALL